MYLKARGISLRVQGKDGKERRKASGLKEGWIAGEKNGGYMGKEINIYLRKGVTDGANKID